MAQFTVYLNNTPASQEVFPYFVDIQAGHLEDLNSRTVIPLSPVRLVRDLPDARLYPVFEIEQEECALMTHEITSIPVSELSVQITSLEQARNEIIAAIDMLISGI